MEHSAGGLRGVHCAQSRNQLSDERPQKLLRQALLLLRLSTRGVDVPVGDALGSGAVLVDEKQGVAVLDKGLVQLDNVRVLDPPPVLHH